MTVGLGETVAIIGPNGSGKTTLIRILAGLTRQDTGKILLSGLDTSRSGEKARRTVGVVAHDSFLYEDLTGFENLHFVGRLFEVDCIEERIESIAARLGITSRLNQRVASLSHGLRKRFAIARAFIHEPRILLMDEPESGLDQQSMTILGDLVMDHVSGGGAVLMTSHDLDWSVTLSNRLAIISSGRIVRIGDTEDVNSIRKEYQVYTGMGE